MPRGGGGERSERVRERKGRREGGREGGGGGERERTLALCAFRYLGPYVQHIHVDQC